MNRKTLLIFLLLAFLTILLGFATNVLSDDFDKWCVAHFGANYKPWLLALLVVGTLIALYFTTDIGKNLFSKSNASDRPLYLSPEETQKNYATIRQYLLEKRYHPRLHQKLAGDQLFNLRIKQTVEGTSHEKAATFVTLQGKKSGEEIKQIFDGAKRRLLVTGVPGAGKTSLLLHLAIELLETEKESLAVLLNLATWTSTYPALDDWLREILPAELGVTKRYAAEILQKGQLTLLLDGLDEVAEEHRASCLKAIGEYGRLGRDYVISTRKDEYKTLEKDAPVWAQIEVQPLTKTQLLAQLDKADRRDFPEAPDLKAALQHDPLLLQVAETPFYLNCLQLLFRGGSMLSELNFKGETMDARQAEIIELFTEQALAIRNPHRYKPKQMRYWMAFLASRLRQRSKVVFELVDLQYDWWRWWKMQLKIASNVESLITIPVVWLLLGLVLGLVLGLFWWNLVVVLVLGLLGLVVGLVLGLFKFVLGLLLGLVGGLEELSPPSIETTENVQWSWIPFFKVLKEKDTLFLILIGGLAVGLVYGLDFGLVYGLVFGLVFGLINILGGTISTLQITTPYQRFTASAKALHFSILQHWLLRWQLYRAGVLPLRLVHFLNEMTARHLLETDGATWRFRHRILQEYFAGQWKEVK